MSTYTYQGWTIEVMWISPTFGYGCIAKKGQVVENVGDGYESEAHALRYARRAIDRGGPYRVGPEEVKGR